MLHLLPASLQQILIGERAAKQNTELSPKDAAEHSGSQDRTQTQESPSVSDDSSSNAHTAASAANVGGLPSRSATTKEGTPNDPARGGSSADADVLQFVLQEKWKEASKPLASSGMRRHCCIVFVSRKAIVTTWVFRCARSFRQSAKGINRSSGTPAVSQVRRVLTFDRN